ncbi:MAG: primosomal protein [Microbacteriaceae bacterium]
MNDENRQGREGDDRGRAPRKPGSGRPSGGRPSSGRPGAGKPSGDRKPYSRDGKPGDRPARPARDGERKPYSRDGKPSGERKPWSRDGERPARPARDGERKPWEKRDGDRRPPRDVERKPWEKRDGDRRPPRDGERKPWEKRDGDRPARDGERKPFSRDGKPGRPERGGADRPRRDYDLNPLTPFELKRREERAMEPELEAQFSGTNLDRAVIRDISTLNEDNKLVVGKHLESAAFFADIEPDRALQHALAAKRRASRLAVVRETVGIMAYVTEDFALALAELRTAARISGSNEQIALIIDCLRALDRSEEGLKIARDLDRAALPREARIDLAIVLSGIRLDRGETDRAYAELQIAELDPTNATIESVGLFDANAEVLEEMGRADEAAKWRRYARLTEEHYAPDEEMTITTEYLEPDPSTFDVTEESDEVARDENSAEVDINASTEAPAEDK